MLPPKQRLEAKLRLERRLTNHLLTIIRDYLSTWAEVRSMGGTVPRMGWQSKINDTLLAHYASVIVAIDGAGDPALPLELIRDAATARRLRDKAQDQSRRIIDRLERELIATEARNRTMKEATADLVTKEAAQRNKFSVMMVSTMRQVWAKVKRTVATISNMSTQDVAEEAAQAPLVEIVPNDAGAETWYKQWISLEDGKVRPAHAAAHGQIVKVEDAFTVNGESLRFPGDGNLGASLGNLINCRCVAQYGVMRDGEFMQVVGLATVAEPARRVRAPGTRPGSAAPRVPTRAFTWASDNTARRIILTTGETANVTVRGGGVTIRVNRRIVASAALRRDAFGKYTLGPVNVSPTHSGVDFQSLLNASVEATNGLKR